MKRDVDFNEISDGKRYGLQDLVKVDSHDCEGCCACCCSMGESILLDPFDVYRLSTGLGKSFGELLEERLELHVVDGVILPNLKMAGPRERCTFLNEAGRCNIHAYRPGICRLFPLGRIYEDHTFQYFLQVNACQKKNRSKIKVKKWIDMPDGRQNERFILEWHDFVQKLQEILMQKPDMEAAKKVNLYVLEAFYYKGWEREISFYEQFDARLVQAGQDLGVQGVAQPVIS